jgi:hypothetical protein
MDDRGFEVGWQIAGALTVVFLCVEFVDLMGDRGFEVGWQIAGVLTVVFICLEFVDLMGDRGFEVGWQIAGALTCLTWAAGTTAILLTPLLLIGKLRFELHSVFNLFYSAFCNFFYIHCNFCVCFTFKLILKNTVQGVGRSGKAWGGYCEDRGAGRSAWTIESVMKFTGLKLNS